MEDFFFLPPVVVMEGLVFYVRFHASYYSGALETDAYASRFLTTDSATDWMSPFQWQKDQTVLRSRLDVVGV